ncbi:unnamed protein product [Trichogramma brassicae]|uniref:Uncharacterized protein n=1 Tax=Trichogramma brassicae TaxID=86971 RepID=A0A6H5IX47_9HYME|nr:unnamed protein product [Trichogramma brassicae]
MTSFFLLFIHRTLKRLNERLLRGISQIVQISLKFEVYSTKHKELYRKKGHIDTVCLVRRADRQQAHDIRKRQERALCCCCCCSSEAGQLLGNCLSEPRRKLPWHTHTHTYAERERRRAPRAPRIYVGHDFDRCLGKVHTTAAAASISRQHVVVYYEHVLHLFKHSLEQFHRSDIVADSMRSKRTVVTTYDSVEKRVRHENSPWQEWRRRHRNYRWYLWFED